MQYQFETLDLSEINEANNIKIDSLLLKLYTEIYQPTGVSQNTYDEFVSKLKQNYKNNSYHNFNHAVDATTTLYHFLNNLNSNVNFYKTITPIDKVTIVTAMLCHDLCHFGKTGQYVREVCDMYDDAIDMGKYVDIKSLTSEEFDLVYNTYLFAVESPLEEFHWIIANEIIMNTNLFGNFDKTIRDDMLDNIHQIILATDPGTLKNFLENIDMSSKIQIFKLFVKCADIGGCLKVFDVHKSWSLKLQEEFWTQGDVMKSIGLKVMGMFDRHTNDFSTGQTMFFQHYAFPLYAKLSIFVNELVLRGVTINNETWKLNS